MDRILLSFKQWGITFLILGLLITPQLLRAQTACESVTAGQITTTSATCPGNGSITVPEVSGGYFTLEGPGITGFIQQASLTFASLNAGVFTAKLYCNGSSDPVSFAVEVEDKYANLTLALNGSMPCANQGAISATASNGFNLGGTGVVYEYGMWPSSVAAANRPDGDVTYGSQTSFTGLDAGTYYVRVKDNCNNFTTKTIDLSPANPAAKVNPSDKWVCSAPSPGLELIVAGTLKSLTDNSNLDPSTFSGYKYSVYILAEGDDCSVTGTPVIVDKAIGNNADMDFSLPAATKQYKIVTTSPCGEVESICYPAPTQPALNFTTLLTPTCSSDGSGRLVVYASGKDQYDLDKSNGNIQVTSATIVGGSPFTPIFNSPINNGRSRFELDPAYSPYTVTYTDGCGVAASEQITFPTAGNEPEVMLGSPRYLRSCVDEGKVNISFEISGWVYGLESNSTQFEIIDVSNNTVVETITGLTKASTNDIEFTNLTAGKTYKVRVVPGGSCATTTSTAFEIPENQGLRFDISHSVVQDCSGNTTTELSVSENGRGGPQYSTTGPGGFTSSNAINSNLVPGIYNYTISQSNSGCTTQKSGSYEVIAGPILPEITKTLALSCQNIGDSPQTTGNALIQFSGNGPFVVEYKKKTEEDYTVIAGSHASEYSFIGLESGINYQFRVIDQCGRSAVQEATVKALKPNVILNTEEPCVDNPYTLSAQPYDDPSATYVWTKEGDAGFNETGREVIFSNFTAANNGTYKLTLTLLNGCVVREALITINSTSCGQKLAAGSIGSFVWYDTNKNGIQDDGELGAEGVSVTLEVFVGASGSSESDPNNWAEVSSQTTMPGGSYLFEELPTGTYRVKFNKPNGYVLTGSKANDGTSTSDSNPDPSTGYSNPIAIDATLDNSDIGRNNLTIDAGLIDDPALPVTLVSFQVSRESGTTANLLWTTSSETNASHFEVQKSSDARRWNSIGNMPAQLSGSSVRSYYFTDAQASNSLTTYYRLKMVDLDNTFAYSKIRTLEASGAKELFTYPNPVKDQVWVDSPMEVYSITLLDLSGRVLKTQKVEKAQPSLQLPATSSGTYLLQLQLKDGSSLLRKITIVQ